MASLSALDIMIMTDRERGLLNRVAVERLARKAYALTRAFRPVQNESDWRRPKGKEGATWKSKMDWESARGIDPVLTDDGAISIPSVDEEVRKEMDREASLLKARAKLDERGGAGNKKDPDMESPSSSPSSLSPAVLRRHREKVLFWTVDFILHSSIFVFVIFAAETTFFCTSLVGSST